MSLTRLPLLFSSALLALAACSGAEDGDDVITPARDAGTTPDAGETPDAGTTRDAGTPDGGSAERDGGTTVGEPIEAPFDTWTWVDVPDSRCMNDTPTGFGVNIHEGATRVLIFMMGGNACFNDGTCFITANADGYGSAKFTNESATQAPLFDRSAASNYFSDWSYVFVPYCSGDVFAGTSGDTAVGGSRYHFAGYGNVGQFLDRIVPTFDDATQVVLTGASAGGFGAMLNFERTQVAFGSGVDVVLLDDSGPPMANEYLAPCLQAHWRSTWGIDDGPLASCPTCIDEDGAFVEGYLEHLKTTFPTNRFGLVSSSADETIRGFFGFGNADCASINGFPGAYSGPRFQMGLEDFRDNLVGDVDNFKLYMPTSTRHVWSNSPLWMITHHGVTLQDWYIGAIENQATWDHVPTP